MQTLKWSLIFIKFQLSTDNGGVFMNIGIAQMDIKWEDIYNNMNKVESFVEKAHEKKVETLFFPEMSLTGFTMDISAHTFLFF